MCQMPYDFSQVISRDFFIFFSNYEYLKKDADNQQIFSFRSGQNV